MTMDRELASKLIRAARKIQNPTKNATNPFLKNRYADLGAVIECTKQSLLDEGIFVVQSCRERMESAGSVLDVVTSFVDSDSGAHLDVGVSVHLKEASPQGSMGAFTYGRRYGLLAAFNIAAEDDDGNVASGKSEDAIQEKLVTKTPEQAVSGIAGILNLSKKAKDK